MCHLDVRLVDSVKQGKNEVKIGHITRILMYVRQWGPVWLKVTAKVSAYWE